MGCKCSNNGQNTDLEVINDIPTPIITALTSPKVVSEVQEMIKKRLGENAEFIENQKISDILADINPTSNTIDLPENVISNTSENIHYLPLIKFPNEEMYEGGWNINCEREGFGISVNKEKTVYKGLWKNNTYGDFGCFVDNTGNYYIGDLNNGKAKGKGEMVVKDKFKFIGEFENDFPCGEGILINFVEKSTYQGYINNGIKEGHGNLKFDDGTVYDGMFKNDEFEGMGKIVYPDGKEYEGEFHKNKKEGKGKLKFEDGLIYEGDFVNDLRHGNGKLSWSENKFYEGKWINDKPHGKGFYYLNGEYLKGTFRYGKIIMEN